VGKVALVTSDHADREANMWAFAAAAFDLLAEVWPRPFSGPFSSDTAAAAAG
jgi:hypothetical protein